MPAKSASKTCLVCMYETEAGCLWGEHCQFLMSVTAKGEDMFQRMSGKGESRSSGGIYVAVVVDG
jgi:hypothetical protein